MKNLKNEIALLIGNGPSSKELLDFGFNNIPESIKTIGLNSFYKKIEEIEWYPNFYAAYDTRVTPFHKSNFKLMMEKYNIERIFSYGNMLKGVPRSYNFRPSIKHITTGGAAAEILIRMGFKEIALIGIDCNYIDYIKESRVEPGEGLIIEKTPEHNPNYFFNTYQEQGDKYRRPNKSWHVKSWRDVSSLAKLNEVKVINCSKQSEIDFFKKEELKFLIK